jgi:hypothetical protein
MYLSYETLMLLLVLAFLIGTLARPARAMLRSFIRAHRAARRATQPIRRRKRSQGETNSRYLLASRVGN